MTHSNWIDQFPFDVIFDERQPSNLVIVMTNWNDIDVYSRAFTPQKMFGFNKYETDTEYVLNMQFDDYFGTIGPIELSNDSETILQFKRLTWEQAFRTKKNMISIRTDNFVQNGKPIRIVFNDAVLVLGDNPRIEAKTCVVQFNKSVKFLYVKMISAENFSYSFKSKKSTFGTAFISIVKGASQYSNSIKSQDHPDVDLLAPEFGMGGANFTKILNILKLRKRT